MRARLLILALACAACAPEPSRRFPAGVAGPLPARLRAEVLRLGFDAAEAAPEGAAVERAADEKWILAWAHDPFRAASTMRREAGRIVRDGDVDF